MTLFSVIATSLNNQGFLGVRCYPTLESAKWAVERCKLHDERLPVTGEGESQSDFNLRILDWAKSHPVTEKVLYFRPVYSIVETTLEEE